MHRLFVATVVVLATSTAARADVEPPSKWVSYDNKQLGITVRHPAAAKVSVHGSTVAIAGGEIVPVTIAVTPTTDRKTGKDGGAHDLQVEWTITVPKRAAHCTATAEDPDKAAVASSICDSIVLVPGARDPKIELVVTSSGLVDGPGYERALRGKAKALDACWIAALRKDGNLPEGAITLARTYTDGQAADTDEKHENFFDHDTRALAGCVSGVFKSVAVKAGPGAASVKLLAICHLY